MTDVPLTLDLRGLRCPLPVLKTRKALATLPVGSTLVVLSDDPFAIVDLQNLARETGERIAEQASLDRSARFVFVKTSGAQDDAGA